jgi:hypothetical protein
MRTKQACKCISIYHRCFNVTSSRPEQSQSESYLDYLPARLANARCLGRWVQMGGAVQWAVAEHQNTTSLVLYGCRCPTGTGRFLRASSAPSCSRTHTVLCLCAGVCLAAMRERPTASSHVSGQQCPGRDRLESRLWPAAPPASTRPQLAAGAEPYKMPRVRLVEALRSTGQAFLKPRAFTRCAKHVRLPRYAVHHRRIVSKSFD